MGSVCLLLRHHMADEAEQPMAASGRERLLVFKRTGRPMLSSRCTGARS